jgi:hypothetical protein
MKKIKVLLLLGLLSAQIALVGLGQESPDQTPIDKWARVLVCYSLDLQPGETRFSFGPKRKARNSSSPSTGKRCWPELIRISDAICPDDWKYFSGMPTAPIIEFECL